MGAGDYIMGGCHNPEEKSYQFNPGFPPAQQLPSCSHGNVGWCHVCDKDCWEKIRELTTRVEALHAYKLTQIDLNKQCGDVIKEFHKGIDNHQRWFSDLEKRIETLEDAYKADYETAKDIIFQGVRTQEIIKKLLERITKLENANFAIDVKLSKLEFGLKEIDEIEDKPEQKTTNLTFGEALEFVKKGDAITRACWRNNKIKITLGFYDMQELRVVTIQGNNCPWMPNHSELLANDWMVIPE